MHQHLCGENYEGLCQKMTSIDGETLLKFLRNVSFQGNFILQSFDPMHQKCTLDRVDKQLNCKKCIKVTFNIQDQRPQSLQYILSPNLSTKNTFNSLLLNRKAGFYSGFLKTHFKNRV